MEGRRSRSEAGPFVPGGRASWQVVSGRRPCLTLYPLACLPLFRPPYSGFSSPLSPPLRVQDWGGEEENDRDEENEWREPGGKFLVSFLLLVFTREASRGSTLSKSAAANPLAQPFHPLETLVTSGSRPPKLRPRSSFLPSTSCGTRRLIACGMLASLWWRRLCNVCAGLRSSPAAPLLRAASSRVHGP